MAEYIKDRVISVAYYTIETGATVRETAKVFGVGKSTIHKDLTDRLLKIDKVLYEKVKEVLKTNKEERHLRGGEATRQKYLEEEDVKVAS
jgi:putative DeoR family transcriptional regulator (stage III sporulation protein D)